MSDFAILFSGSALVLLAAALGIIGLVRGRARKRWQAAVDAFAEREALRDRRRRPPKRARTFSTRSGASKGIA